MLSNPKGASVKAMLIHSGELMSQYDAQSASTVQGSISLQGSPDMYQVCGFVSTLCMKS